MTAAADKIKYPNRFRKGRSGNYRGRPLTDIKVRQLARQCSSEAIEVLLSVATDLKASPKTKEMAARTLLGIAWGKSKRFADLGNIKMTVQQYIERLQFKKMGMSDAFIDRYVLMQESERNKVIATLRDEF